MRIDFFEEFPERGELQKAKLLDFDCTTYIAAKSFKEFKGFKRQLEKINPNVEAGYWPILQKSYWISPFSYSAEIEGLSEELRACGKKHLKVLLDLEFPLLKKGLFLRNLPYFLRNKNKIKELFRDSEKFGLEILAAEYPSPTRAYQKFLEIGGISYSFDKFPNHKKVIMYYTSVMNELRSKDVWNHITKGVLSESKKYRNKIKMGVGVIAGGILGDENILSPLRLDRDLELLKNNHIDNVVIFRLGGLNKDYMEVIKKFV
ncbi:MAG: hypothetical protein KKG60_00160 [Nanoarchaeota archaeon]|nr:hypothetical protein [Nanoarchaeota archaeon]